MPAGGATIVEQGHLPDAVHISKSYVEQQIEGAVTDRDAPVVLYCAGGVRSLFAAQSLEQLGYTNVASMSGGFQAWKSAGLPWEAPVILSAELLGSKALLIGAGGLGSPAALYLAAAGVGTIGIVDFDVVDLSNLQRQILHTNDRVGERKVESARKTINALNPDVNVITHEEMLVAENVDRIIAGYDVIIDGTGSRASSRPSSRTRGRAIAASTRRRHRPSSPQAARLPACSASCRGSWACSRPTRRSRSSSGSARRWPAGCSCSMPSTRPSPT